MASDHDRRELYEALERRLGQGPAATMMELLPPVGWADVARQSDLVAVRGEMAQLRGELKGEMAELRGEMAELRADLKQEIGELRSEIRSQLPRLYAANVGMAFATAGLVLAAAKLA
jgi:hypothetical protein